MCMDTKPRKPQNLTIFTTNDSLKKLSNKNCTSLIEYSNETFKDLKNLFQS